MSEQDGPSLAAGAADQPAADTAGAAARANGTTAGALLRQARQAKGLHIAALAAALKVPQRKLEALEADRYTELPDATFARALAQTMCRALKVDPSPVLALLPQVIDPELDRVARGLNQPFRDRPGREEPNHWAWLQRPGPLLAVGLVVASAAVYLAPASFWSMGGGEAAPNTVTSEPVFPPAATDGGGDAAASAPLATPASAVSGAALASGLPATMASAAQAPVLAASALVSRPVVAAQGASKPTPTIAAPAPVVAALPTPNASAAAAVDGPLRIRAKAQTWVEVQDSSGRVLISRTLQAGEQAGLDGQAPFKLKVGNVAGTEMQFRGQAVDLTSRTRDNVARFELP